MAAAVPAMPARSADARPDASRTAEKSARKVFELAIANGRLTGGTETIRVAKGDEVELRLSSDKPVTLHLHGYDIEIVVAPGAPATMSFKAYLPGRFPVSEHRKGAKHHHAVLYVEVHP
jgi:FtsP/CotA-like multicopper oxidase with cupredoxin domain